VTFWAGEDTTISAADQRELTNFMYQALETQLSQKFQVVNKTGPGVMVVQVATLDATTATPGLRSASVVEPHVRAVATLKHLPLCRLGVRGGEDHRRPDRPGSGGRSVQARRRRQRQSGRSMGVG